MRLDAAPSNSKSLIAQQLLNNLPLWSLARKNESANLATLLGDTSMQMWVSRMHGLNAQRNLVASTNDAAFAANVYAWPLDLGHVFAYQDLINTIEYELPSITATDSEGGPYTLAVYRDQEEFLNSIDIIRADVGDTILDPSQASLAVKSGTVTSLQGEYVYFFFDNYVTIKVWGDQLVGLIEESTVSLLTIELKNLHTNDKYCFRVSRNSVFRSEVPLPTGLYEISFSMATEPDLIEVAISSFSTLELSKYVFENNAAYSNPIESYPASLRIGPDDPAYLELVGPASTAITSTIEALEDVVYRSHVVLDELENFLELISLAKLDHSSHIYALSADHVNRIYIYSSLDQQPATVLNHNLNPYVALTADPLDYKIGETIELVSRKKSSIMTTDIQKLRLRVDNIEASTSIYIDRNGNTVAENLAWIRTAKAATYQETRWNYEFTQMGTHRFVLEAVPVGGGDSQEIEHVVLLPYKVPITYFEVPIIDQIESICWLADGRLAFTTDTGYLMELNLVRIGAYVDFKEYMVYTLSDFDQIEVT